MIRKIVLLLLVTLCVSSPVLLGIPVSLFAESEKTSPQMCEKRINVREGSQCRRFEQKVQLRFAGTGAADARKSLLEALEGHLY